MSRRIARFAFLALGLIGVSALLLQPICEAAERHGTQAHSASQVAPAGGDEGDLCCSVLAPASLSAAPVAYASNVPVTAPIVGTPRIRPHLAVSRARPAVAPPPVLRYYVRSARIQR